MIRVRSSSAASSGVSDDVHAGDEAGHAGRGVREPCGLQDLGDAVERAEHERVLPGVAGQAAQRPGRHDQQHRRDREPDRQEVQDRHPLEEVLDQEERRAPDGGDAEQEQRRRAGTYGGTPSRRRAAS